MMIDPETQQIPDNMRLMYNKSMKPLMEKRRRARINASLEELKSILQSLLSEEALVSSKMEKADILDLAVRFLRGLRRKNMNMTCHLDPNAANKFQSGYMDCMSEISRFVASSQTLAPELQTQMLGHLLKTSPMGSVVSPPSPVLSMGLFESFSPISVVPSVSPQRLASTPSLSPRSDISDLPPVPDIDAYARMAFKHELHSPYLMKQHVNKVAHQKVSHLWRPW